MISGKIELHKLTHVVMEKKGKDGNPVKGLFIPITHNRIFEGKDGAFYLNLIAFDTPKAKGDQTHGIKISLSKEDREKMSKEEQNEIPFIGSLNVNFGGSSSTTTANAAPGVVLSEDDDLPF